MKRPIESPVQPGERSESGMALVVLLVVALFVGLVGVAMMDDTVSEVQIAVNESNAVQARYLAEAGIADAANRLTQDNTWVGPVTQSSFGGGQGSYTVKVDSTVSNSAVKVLVSTGSVFARSSQTVRETVLVLPQAFSKALVSNTSVTTAAVSGIMPTVQNTVLRQLGTIHANNLRSAATSVTLAAGTQAIGTVTATSGTVTLAGLCIACRTTPPAPTIPFPSFNFATYTTLATNNVSPCPAVQANTLFTSQANFDSCISAVTADASGRRTINGVWLVNAVSLKLPNVGAEKLLTLNGTLIAYNTTASGCTAASPCGDITFVSLGVGQSIILTAQNGEPAVMTGGQILITGSTSPGTVAITGLVYILANTANPVTLTPFPPGFNLAGSATAPVTLTGMLVGQIIGQFNSNSLRYDPSSFFPGLPSGLVTPTSPPFTLLPISWSSGK